MKLFLTTASFVLLILCEYCQSRTFQIDHKNNVFRKDGEPFRFIAAEVNYFRIHESNWRDRLLKVKAAGFNSLQTYIEWSSHEPNQGQYYFQGKKLKIITILFTVSYSHVLRRNVRF